jgi:NADPH-dependent curcumin reductase CurA
MSEGINRQVLLARRPVGEIRDQDFELREAPRPEVGGGQFLVRNLWLSFDPTQRGWMSDLPGYMPPVPIGGVMRALAVGQVVESDHPEFKAGDYVSGGLGWQDWILTDGMTEVGPLQRVPDGIDPKAMLSVLGITGLTAYFGMIDVGQVAGGDTVVVSGAAGATGSVAGQIAAIKGASRVIGIAGGREKCGWLTDVAGFDVAIDYRTENVLTRLADEAPNGIDVVFENVGGDILEASLANLAMRARIALCGAISTYNQVEPSPGPRNYLQLVIKRARLEGFLVLDYAPRFGEAVDALVGWVNEGRVHYAEDIQEGLENAPATLRRLFSGQNLGKQLLKIADAPIA